jgi:hypothetical protein
MVPIRPDKVKELLKNKKLAEVRLENDRLTDKGKGTMIDTIDGSSFINLANGFLKQNHETGLRDRACLLLTYGLAARGENVR